MFATAAQGLLILSSTRSTLSPRHASYGLLPSPRGFEVSVGFAKGAAQPSFLAIVRFPATVKRCRGGGAVTQFLFGNIKTVEFA